MKIEQVIMLNNIRQFSIFEKEGLTTLIQQENSFSNTVKKVCLDMTSNLNSIDRIYFGTEFCDNLIPSIGDIKKIKDYCSHHDYGFSLVLPYITEGKLDCVDQILKDLNDLKEDIEVVCNDWGIVYLINQKYTCLKIVLGRLLDKMSKDSRLSDRDYHQLFDQNSLFYIKNSNLHTKSYQNILKKNDIKRVELDCPPQGLCLSDTEAEEDISVSVYVPFGFITTGRMCMMRFLGQSGKEKYSLENECTHQCQLYNQVMKKMKNCQFDKDGKFMYKNLEFYRKGNTIFYLTEQFEDIIKTNHEINRIIYQVGIHV